MSGHTPKPWLHRRFDDAQIVILGSDPPRLICTCTGEDREANAPLIAKAPEMLEALESCVHLCEREALDTQSTEFAAGALKRLNTVRELLGVFNARS